MRIDTLRRCCRKMPGLRDQLLRLLRGEMDSCRYCLEGSDGEALISCCACRGTIGFVHFSCLEKAFARRRLRGQERLRVAEQAGRVAGEEAER